MPHESGFRKLLEQLDFALKPEGNRIINAGLCRKQANHDRLVGPFAQGFAKQTGMTFMEDVEDSVVVDMGPPGTDVAAARRAIGNFFRDQAITFRT